MSHSTWPAWALIMITAMVATPATAAPKYGRKGPVEVAPAERERTRALRARDDAPAAPTMTADEALAGEAAVEDVRAEVVASYRQLVDETPDSEPDDKAEALFQLAEVEARRNRFWRLEATRLTIAADAAKGKARARLRDQAEVAAKTAKAALVASIKAFQQLTTTDALGNWPQLDRAVFLLGYTLQLGGYGVQSRATYRRLLADFPASPFGADAHYALAEHHFEQAGVDPDARATHLEHAADELDAVLALGNPRLHEHARYKLGWVRLNQQQPQRALEAFFEVAKRTRGDAELAPLRRAALKDLVRAFAAVGNVEKAHAFFTRVDKPAAFDMLRWLGDHLAEQGQADKAIHVFRQLIKLDRAHADVCLWQYEITRAMLTAGTRPQQVAEIERLVGLYGALKGTRTLPAEALAACHDDAAAMASDHARQLHAEADKTRDPDTMDRAGRLYDVYVATFAGDRAHPEVEYYRAELRWMRAERERDARRAVQAWEDAAVAFGEVVARAKVDEARLGESAYAAVAAWYEAMTRDPRLAAERAAAAEAAAAVDQADAALAAPQPTPLADREAQMIAAVDVYLARTKDPRGELAVDLAFLAANVLRRHDQLDGAVTRLGAILTAHRDHAQAEIAADLLLHALNRLGRHDEMLRWVGRLVDDAAFLARNPALATRLTHLQRQARRKAAEACEVAAKSAADPARWLDCGEQYLAIYQDDVDAADADVVLFDAAVCFEEGKSIGAAILALEHLVEHYPRSKVSARGLGRLGLAYARIAYYDKAAAALETYARRWAGEDDADEAMSDAVFYRKGIGDDQQAIADTRYFVDTFGKRRPADAAEAWFNLTAVHEKLGDPEKVIRHLRGYLERHGKQGGVDRQILAWTRIGELAWQTSCKVATVDGACVTVRRERAVRAAGKASRRRTGKTAQCGEPSKVQLRVVARDERRVKEARRAFAAAIAAYERVDGKTGGDEGAATHAYAVARFHRGEAHHEQFLALPFPTGLDFSADAPARAKKSLARFDAWMQTKASRGAAARVEYEALIFEVKDPAQAIAAAARLGQLQQSFSGALFTAEIPAAVRDDEDARDAYCDRLIELAQPLEDKAIEAFGACLDTSTRLGWASDWSRICERELGQLRPERYPTARELRAVAGTAADAATRIVSREQAVVRLPAAR